MILLKNAELYDGINRRPRKMDILVEEDKIKEIGPNLEIEGAEVYDLKGKMVIPGGVDVHTHINHDMGDVTTVDTFETGTRAAAFGGTTTILDHIAYGQDSNSRLVDRIDYYEKLAKDNSYIDYGFHGSIYNMNPEMEGDVKKLSKEGIKSYKIYTTYGEKLNDYEILKVLSWAKEEDLLVCIHAENDGITLYAKEKLEDEGKIEPRYYGQSRPAIAEVEAVKRILHLAELVGEPDLYFVHISSKRSLAVLKEARDEGYENLYIETCTQYLVLDDEVFEDEDAYKYICSPPIREASDGDFLWDYIQKGMIDVIATDHCPFYYKYKSAGVEDFRDVLGGVPGIEERIPVIITEGTKRGINIGVLVELLCTNPAKLFGLYPKKGVIRRGSDADMVILKEVDEPLTIDKLNGGCDYSIFEGYHLNYKVDSTLLRGEFVIKNGELVGELGRGEYLIE